MMASPATWWRLGGLTAGGGLVYLVGWSDPLGRGAAVTAAAFVAAVVLGILAGEIVTPRPPRGVARTATLQRRRAWDYVPHRAIVGVFAAATGLTGLLVTAVLTASPDDTGRPGRSVAFTCPDPALPGRVLGGSSAGPWPGGFYAATILAATLTALLLCWVALRSVLLRPRPARPDGTPVSATELARDDLYRGRLGVMIAAAGGIAVSVPLAGVAAMMAGALHSVASSAGALVGCVPGWLGAASGLLAGLAALSGLAFVWYCALLLIPGQPRVAGSTAR